MDYDVLIVGGGPAGKDLNVFSDVNFRSCKCNQAEATLRRE